MGSRTSYIVALTSLSLIALELVWTRLLSAEFFYTYAFLVLSLAIMGLGLGALAFRMAPGLGSPGKLGGLLVLCTVTALGAPVALMRLGLDFSTLFSDPISVVRLLAAVVLLGLAFFLGGIVLAACFRRNPERITGVYMADLVGAGLGVALAILAMNRLGTPAAAFWMTLPLLAAAALASGPRTRGIPLVLGILVVILSGSAEGWLETQREERAPVIYRHWDAMAKIKVYDFGGEWRGINIDNVANSPVVPFDGDWESDPEDEESGWDIDVGHLVAQFDSCTFLSLGAGGGMDVLQALDHGATEVHAVEVNPHINRMMTRGDPDGYVVLDSTTTDSTGRVITLAEFSGRIYHDPRVRVVTEDARSYVRRHPGTFDVIYSLSSNTWAALGSGSFALAENYLFTTEAFRDYWKALSPGGFLSMEHQVYMPRLVSEVKDALTAEGVEDPAAHFAVYNLPSMRRNLLLVSRRPLTPDLRYRAYGELTPDRAGFIHPLYPAPDSLPDNLIHGIVTRGWEAMGDSTPVNLSPATDDRPFVAQMGQWRNLDRAGLKTVSKYAEFRGFPASKLILVTVLVLVTVVFLPLTLLPYARSGPGLPGTAWVYFFLIGIAFMAVEVVLIQRYALFLGASSYSTATVLFTLLVAAGLGSRVAARPPTALVFVAIPVLLLIEALLLFPLTAVLASQPLAVRVTATVLLIAPLGFFLGMPFPKGSLRVGDQVDWAFAVNGIASVLGATAVLLAAFRFGFTLSLLGAAALYAVAGFLLGIMGSRTRSNHMFPECNSE